MSTWKKYKLDELIEIVGGGTPRTTVSEYWNGDIPWLSVVDFGGDKKYVHQTEKSITEAGLKNSSTKILKKGEIIISARGTVGEMAMLGRNMAFNQSCYGIRAKDDYAVNSYLYYLLKFHIQGLKSISHGSVFDTITRETFNQIEVEIPEDTITQARIASILSALDDKIELNSQMNQTLEQMAQALFKKYFVEGVDMEKLPEGWTCRKVGEFVDTVSVTHKFPKQTIIFLNTSDILSGEVLHRNYSDTETLPGQAKKSIRKNDILFSEIRPANRRFAFVNFEADDYVVSTKLMVLRAKSNIHPLFLYFFLTQNEILDELQNIAESRSGTFPQITFDQLKELKFLIPTDGRMDRFIEKCLIPSYEKIFLNNEETKSLIQLRDTLLPKLMNGALEVNAAIENEILS